jgi:signal peptidase I
MQPRTDNSLARVAAICLIVAVVALCVLFVTGCGPKSDAQFEPTMPLVVMVAVSGESMLPALPAWHLAPIDIAARYDRLAVGDVVLFWDYRRQGFTLHRLVARQGPWWIAQGDNPETNPVVDPPFVTRANFIGRFVGQGGAS